MGPVGAQKRVLGEVVRLALPGRGPEEVAVDLPVMCRDQGVEAFGVHAPK